MCWWCDTDVTTPQSVWIRLNLPLMWQHSLGLRSHAFSPERQYQWDVNLHLTTNPSPHTLLSVFYPHKSRWLHHTNFFLLQCAAVSWLLKLLHFCQSSLASLCLSFFCSCFITWSICGWFTNLRWISESIYLLTLTHRDMLLPITFLFKPMSFWLDHLPT